MTRVFVVAAIVLLAGCNLFRESSTPIDTRHDVGNAVDSGNDTGGVRDIGVDAPSCVPETAEEICTRLGAACGALAATDLCGSERAVTCGSCDPPQMCGQVAPNQCDCVREDDETFCQRVGRDCDPFTGVDNCAATRTADCGTCPNNEACGEQTPNVCGCPCLIDGVCRPVGTANPDNLCEVCDPEKSATGWTVTVGAACDDGNFCTEATTCSAAGECLGTDVDCSAFTTDCRAGVCDPSAGCFAVDLSDVPCTSDGDNCTVDRCVAGTCTHTVATDNCVIGGTCFAEGVTNPANDCETCDPDANDTGWTALPVDTTCTDVDDYVCSYGACDGAGVCNRVYDANFCTEADLEICVRDGQGIGGLSCIVCNATMNAFEPALDGTTCVGEDALACTTGACLGGLCQPVPDAGFCAIDGVCYANGTVSPTDECQRCDTATSQTSWTARANGTMCGSGLMCMAGDCGASPCAPLPADRCLIHGVCYAAGETSPSNICQVCDPSSSQTAFTESTGACDLGLSCAPTGICGGFGPGVCFAFPQDGWCVVDGVCYQDGDINPARSCEACAAEVLPIAWWPRDGSCSVGGVCASDGQANPSSPCEICDAENPLTWSIRPTSCKIDGTCYDAGDAQPGSPCRVCDPSKAQTQWSNAPNSTICGGVTCTCDNGTCDTSGGC